ncbi:MAG TPA: FtsX-like permease family protein, partial [Longimicrobiales bacterium]
RGTGSSAARLQREGFPDDAIRFYRHSVTTDYFETLRIPLIAGRLFTDADRADAPGVVVVSEAFAKRLWPGENAIGKRIVLGSDLVPVIGVVGDVHYRDLTTSLMDPTNDPDLYFAHAQLSSSGPTDILVRVDGDPAAVTAGVRDAVRRIDPTRALFNIAGMETTLRTQTSLGRLASSLLTLFAVLSLVLAAVGLYGVMSFVVRGRQREIAIRSAVGARPGDIRRLVMGQSFTVVLVGLAIGLAGALAAGRILAGLLYGIDAVDPLVLSLTAGALMAAAFVASWLPARTAMKVAPRTAMASE